MPTHFVRATGLVLLFLSSLLTVQAEETSFTLTDMETVSADKPTTIEAELASFAGEPACDAGCKGGGDSCGCGGGLLDRLLTPSDQCFSDFISPMTNPVFFEDPRTLTEARVIYLRHKVPLAATGGEIDLIGVQLRAAINDRLSIIATKDGYATSTNPLIDDGWVDVSAGLKLNVYSDPELQRLVSAGLVYEMPVGSTRTQQGNGDGLFNVFLSAGAEIGDQSHWVTGAGFLLPADRSAESSMFYWSNHFDRRIACTNIYLLAEVNWYHYMGAGDAFNLAPVEGGDLWNFGTVGVAGNDIVTGAFGIKLKPRECIEVGVAWEAPLTKRRDVLDNRLTVDCILRY